MENKLNVCKDLLGCFCVGVVVSVGLGIDECIVLLVEVGVDVLFIDMFYGYF